MYDDFCIRCHLPNGKGQIGIIPPLAKSDFLYEHMEESIKALKFGGIDGEIIVNGVKYNPRMEKMGLYNDEIAADVMNYILNSWGNKSDLMITEEYVDKLKTMFLIGICGGSGSGKTTLALKLKKYFKSRKIGHLDCDSYYIDNSHLPMKERSKINLIILDKLILICCIMI